VGPVLSSPEFLENSQQQLRELIRQNYNHPSIFFWSIGNETRVTDPAVTPADTNDRVLAALSRTVTEEDPARLSTYAVDGDASDNRAGHTDVVGFNRYFGWYLGKPEDFAPWLDAQHAAFPAMKIGMSEYGAGANTLQHEEPAKKPVPGGPWHPEEWQARFHEVYWRALAERPWVWCKLVWCMFDLGSDGRKEGGQPGLNDKGLVTYDRKTRKDAFYWYQANWSEKPVLHITSRRFTPRTEKTTTVKIYSNAPSVELRVNGVSLGARSSTDHIFLWPEVVLRDGANLVEASATRGAEHLSDRCEWVLKAQP
jgi:beta-galactosidase